MASKAFQAVGTMLQRAGVTIAEMMKIQGTGSKADEVDVTNMDSPGAYREFITTLLDAGTISFDGNLIADDPTQAQVQADFDGRVRSAWSIVLPVNPATGATYGHWDFQAFVSSVDFDLPHDKQATISGKLRITGPRPFTVGA
jgi:predicted secreted protein